MSSASSFSGRAERNAIARPAPGGYWPSQCDIVAGLWLEAPFTRLPADAPCELEELLTDIHDPRRSYVVHKASRRQDFQHLVARFMLQLREGCGDLDCNISTCLTCRKRYTGRKPLRRYSPTSARMLAVYMAGAHNPYNNLCSALRSPRRANGCETLPHLIITPRRVSTPGASPEKMAVSRAITAEPDIKTSTEGADHHRNGSSEPTSSRNKLSEMALSTKAADGDHRSFAAATFETVAIKMLQWLSPSGLSFITNLHNNLDDADVASAASHSDQSTASEPGNLGVNPASDVSGSDVICSTPLTTAQASTPVDGDLVPSDSKLNDGEKWNQIDALPSLLDGRRRSADSSTINTQRADARLAPRTTRLDLRQVEKQARTVRAFSASRDFSSAEIVLRKSSIEGRLSRASIEPPSVHHPRADFAPPILQDRLKTAIEKEDHTSPDRNSSEPESEESSPYVEDDNATTQYRMPQTLQRFTPDVIDFICDVYAEESLSTHANRSATEDLSFLPIRETAGLARLALPRTEGYRRVWKAFIDQAIFSVLSTSAALIDSFTANGRLLESQTIWYCMMRLTRAAPDIVFHSLWLSAEDLLQAPEILRSARKDKAAQKGANIERAAAKNIGHLISICLHALVAAAPVVSDAQILFRLSRLHGNGQALPAKSGSPDEARLYLEYNDTFANELAIRLARRLFLAIAAHGRYDIVVQRRSGQQRRKSHDPKLLNSLLSQLNFSRNEDGAGLKFSSASRLLHEARLPMLLLDWARTIIVTDWRGEPYFARDSAFGGAMSFLKTLHQQRGVLVLGDVHFRIDFLGNRLDPVDTAVNWIISHKVDGVEHVLDYPFLFSAETLVSFFRAINFARMSRTFESSRSLQTRMRAIVETGSLITNPHHKVILGDMLKTASTKYLVLDISRKNALNDAFDQIWRRERRELLRPLKVRLGEDNGEEGFDSGGVQQEFFRLIIAECLNPDFGAFSVDDRTKMAWFVPGSPVEAWKFELIGVLFSLAIYNGLTLPITFPRAFYKKLLGVPATELHHIADGWPDLASGLTQLLEWDEESGAIEDVFARTYEFSVAQLGTYVSRDMTQHECDWPTFEVSAQSPPEGHGVKDAPLVTNANRDEYVRDYVRYLTDISIRPQFEAFWRGFNTCLCSRSLLLLSAPILHSVVEGVQDIDISELRRNVRYVGWTSHHRTIKDFWSIVKKYDLNMKRKLLEFVTASDRVPVGGFRNIQFVVQKNGEENGEGARLPTAYTCYGTLLLPEYNTKDILKERLSMALENAQGFGFA